MHILSKYFVSPINAPTKHTLLARRQTRLSALRMRVRVSLQRLGIARQQQNQLMNMCEDVVLFTCIGAFVLDSVVADSVGRHHAAARVHLSPDREGSNYEYGQYTHCVSIAFRTSAVKWSCVSSSMWILCEQAMPLCKDDRCAEVRHDITACLSADCSVKLVPHERPTLTWKIRRFSSRT